MACHRQRRPGCPEGSLASPRTEQLILYISHAAAYANLTTKVQEPERGCRGELDCLELCKLQFGRDVGSTCGLEAVEPRERDGRDMSHLAQQVRCSLPRSGLRWRSRGSGRVVDRGNDGDQLAGLTIAGEEVSRPNSRGEPLNRRCGIIEQDTDPLESATSRTDALLTARLLATAQLEAS